MKEKGTEKEEKKKRKPLPDMVEESNSIGADAGDATSGVPMTPSCLLYTSDAADE